MTYITIPWGLVAVLLLLFSLVFYTMGRFDGKKKQLTRMGLKFPADPIEFEMPRTDFRGVDLGYSEGSSITIKLRRADRIVVGRTVYTHEEFGVSSLFGRGPGGPAPDA